MPVPRIKKQEREKKLPSYWQRISGVSSKKKLDIEIEKNKGVISLDRTGSWYSFLTPIELIEKKLGVKIRHHIRRRISRCTEKKPFRVLDVGCGEGSSLRELKQMFGKRIRTVGLVLEKTEGEWGKGQKNIDRLIAGHIKDINPREKFDLAYSHMGPFAYTELKTIAMQKLIEWLKPNGIAIIDFEKFSKDDLHEVQTVLRQNGIRHWKIANRRALIFKKSGIRVPN